MSEFVSAWVLGVMNVGCSSLFQLSWLGFGDFLGVVGDRTMYNSAGLSFGGIVKASSHRV